MSERKSCYHPHLPFIASSPERGEAQSRVGSRRYLLMNRTVACRIVPGHNSFHFALQLFLTGEIEGPNVTYPQFNVLREPGEMGSHQFGQQRLSLKYLQAT